MPYTKSGETPYHAQLQDKDRAIKELVVYYMLLDLILQDFGQRRRDWFPLDILGCCFLRSSVINKSRPTEVMEKVLFS